MSVVYRYRQNSSISNISAKGNVQGREELSRQMSRDEAQALVREVRRRKVESCHPHIGSGHVHDALVRHVRAIAHIEDLERLALPGESYLLTVKSVKMKCGSGWDWISLPVTPSSVIWLSPFIESTSKFSANTIMLWSPTSLMR